MEVIVHRGTHQIGGCCTEVSTGNTRIFIDCGASLPGSDKGHLNLIESGSKDNRSTAVLISHYHGDHVGELDRLPPGIPIYMGTATRNILNLYKEHGGGICPDIDLEHVIEIQNTVPFSIGDLRITPVISDHSAFGSYMFLIEGDGKRVLHTGDYRLHGPHGNRLLKELASSCNGVDLLITEGTSLTRWEEYGYDEKTVEHIIGEIANQYKYCFVLCSSGNIDRIASVAGAVKSGRYFLMDKFQKSILQSVSLLDGEYSSWFRKALSYGRNLAEKAEKYGFCMIVRANSVFERTVAYYADKYPDETCLIYSMWSGYLECTSVARLYYLTNNHRIVHSSGHVTPKDLKKMIDILSPFRILMIHTDSKDPGSCLMEREKLILAKDKEVIPL